MGRLVYTHNNTQESNSNDDTKRTMIEVRPGPMYP